MENNGINPRIPPHSIEAEQSVLGGVLLDNHAINVALEKISSDDFYLTSHQVIFQAMFTLSDKRQRIDIVTLAEELRNAGHLEQSGGSDHLAQIATLVPSAANVGYYANVVKNLSLRRSMIQQASAIVNESFAFQGEISDFLDSAEQKILGVSDQRMNQNFIKAGDVVQSSIKLIEELYDKKDAITGISTGFDRLNNITSGLQNSDLIILAARPAMGKTSLALNIAQWVAIQEKKAIAMFSLEMSKEQLVLRLLCSEARVSNTKIRSGQLGDRDFPRIVEAGGRIADAPIYLDDTPALSVTELRAKCRRLHRDTPLSLILVDYLQLMRSPLHKNSREQEISDISRSLKALAKELNIPVIALSQLNRSVESRPDKRPLMSDLRESGAIEQDADIIMFIYRDEVYNEDTPDAGVAELIVSKHRSGPTGVARLAFSPEFTRFDNLEERVEAEEFQTVVEGIDMSIIDSGDLF